MITGMSVTGLLGVGYQKFGKDQKLRDNPMEHLFEVFLTFS